MSSYVSSCGVLFNPRTNMQTHTPTVVLGEGGWNPPPPTRRFFVTLRSFEKFLPLMDSLLCRLQDDFNIMEYVCK